MTRRAIWANRFASWASVVGWQESPLPDREPSPSPLIWTASVVPPVPPPVKRAADLPNLVVW